MKPRPKPVGPARRAQSPNVVPAGAPLEPAIQSDGEARLIQAGILQDKGAEIPDWLDIDDGLEGDSVVKSDRRSRSVSQQSLVTNTIAL